MNSFKVKKLYVEATALFAFLMILNTMCNDFGVILILSFIKICLIAFLFKLGRYLLVNAEEIDSTSTAEEGDGG